MWTMKVDADRVIAKMDARKVAIPKAMDRVVGFLGMKLLRAMIERAPGRTGKLRRSIFAEVPTRSGAFGENVIEVEQGGGQSIARLFVSPDTPYAKFVEYGTKPHDIYPSKASALRFLVGGKEVFAKHVKHPGTMARLYVHGPFEEMKPEIVAKIEAAMREAIK